MHAICMNHIFQCSLVSLKASLMYEALQLLNTCTQDKDRRDSLFRLVKAFSSETYAQSFLAGKLYMNPLGFFWDHGNESQRDILEGASFSVDPRKLDAFPKEFRDAQLCEMQLVPTGFAYCNVCCFSMQTICEIDGNPAIDISDLDGFGRYIVAIDNIAGFLGRLRDTVALHGFDCAFGPVEYRFPNLLDPGRNIGHTILLKSETLGLSSIFPENPPNMEYDCFIKARKYEHQREWRIALHRGVAKQKPYVLNIGSLHSFAHLVSPDQIDADAQRACYNASAWLHETYGGNATRQQLREKFFRLGNEEVYSLATIG